MLNNTSLRTEPAISSHPLFAVVVPIWFAALFSLSTLAIRGSLLEEMVLTSHLDLVLPMAAPPLGATARVLVALLFGGIGAMIGKLLVALLARSAAGRSQESTYPAYAQPEEMRLRGRDSHPDAPARRPISAHAELGEEGLGAPVPPALVEYDYSPQVDTGPAFADFDNDYAAPVEPLPAFLQPAPAMAPSPASHDTANHAQAGFEQAFDAPAAFAPAPMPAPPTAALAPEPTPQLPPAPPTAAQRIASAPLEDLSHVELIERLAITMQRRNNRVEQQRAATGFTPSLAASNSPEHPLESDETARNRTKMPQSEPESDHAEANLRAALASLRGLK